jgi:surfactin synthase thioesterase subunit
MDGRVRARLFCFPYAGGGHSIFAAWARLVPEDVEVCGFQVPGHGSRFREPPYVSWERLVEHTVHAIAPLIDRPFALFGHSMGAVVAFECARMLQSERLPQPRHLVVSACSAPRVGGARRARPIHELETPDLLAELAALGGTPPGLLERRELVEFVLPKLRADFRMLEEYRYEPGEPLRCPLAAFAGSRDSVVTLPSCLRWSQHSRGAFSVHVFEGDHFFLHSQPSRVVATVTALLADGLPSRRCEAPPGAEWSRARVGGGT